ncbi:condensation domain-containing protein [Mycobacterium riyadhense]|uniref:Trehalose-2-sulfate acyltransferase papA2 n=1 Tax=Mycobacterium riyadhense TaxID=486698 RepID=A0A653EIC6_9MYCO|nr:condensation domain-containing protein [Mycobacterium riyadhense]VTO97269.1 Trehalose-2-sulfate acyltransferase papA2 [Mycobacterium riyadhense]
MGHLGLGTVSDWVPAPGSAWLWRASPRSLQKARQAPTSTVPPSYIQARHLRSFCEQQLRGREMSRLLVIAFDIPGQCDIRALTYVFNAHLRRHDTYRSWFEFTDSTRIVRHTMTDPADIELIAVERGEMTPKQWQDHLLATPGPLDWECFRFAIIQRDDHFTVCISVDHLHVDPMYIGSVFWEIRAMYNALMDGDGPIALPPAGSYADYCLRERAYTSSLTLRSPEIGRWIDIFEANDGSLPSFPLPLGDTSLSTRGELLSLRLLDAQQTARFEAACTAAGARFSGGVFAAAALTDFALTGSETYYAVTPVGTRRTSAEFLTTGWFIGHVPFAVPVASSFAATARGAQTAFDSSTHLANVPFERVLELARWLRKPPAIGGFPMLSFLDWGVPPLSAVIATQLGRMNTRAFNDGRIAARVCMWVNKFHEETTVTASFPSNPIAHESIARYLETMKSVYLQVAAGRELTLSRGAAQLQS